MHILKWLKFCQKPYTISFIGINDKYNKNFYQNKQIRYYIK